MQSREQQLEDEIEVLKQKMIAATGSSRELGVLMSVRHGMTRRLATMLFVLVERSPALITKQAFHTVFYGSRDDGGPEPGIFSVHVSRLRKLLRRLNCPGKIETVWNAWYKASPELVAWVRALYAQQIKED